jgi:hypothetical protein
MAVATVVTFPIADPVSVSGPRPVERDLEGLAPPHNITPIGAVRARQVHAVEGVVTSVAPRQWVGGPVLEVTLCDDGHELLLAFFGRYAIAGVEVGTCLYAAGMVGRRRRQLAILNPRYWLSA